MGVIKNMLEDIEIEKYIDSQSDDYDDLESIQYDKEYEKMIEAEREAKEYKEMIEAERKADKYYQELFEEEEDNIAREFPGYNPDNGPNFTNVPTLGGCLSYLLFSGIGLLIIWLIVENL